MLLYGTSGSRILRYSDVDRSCLTATETADPVNKLGFALAPAVASRICKCLMTSSCVLHAGKKEEAQNHGGICVTDSIDKPSVE